MWPVDVVSPTAIRPRAAGYTRGLHALQDLRQLLRMKPSFFSHSPLLAHSPQRSGCSKCVAYTHGMNSRHQAVLVSDKAA
jgi:hypothetical protein